MVSNLSEAIELASKFYGRPKEWFANHGAEGDDALFVIPFDEELEGNPRFFVYKESGKVRKLSVRDWVETNEWFELSTTREVSL